MKLFLWILKAIFMGTKNVHKVILVTKIMFIVDKVAYVMIFGTLKASPNFTIFPVRERNYF